jgi:hypothetical protein
MFEINMTQVFQTLQSADYGSIIYTLVTKTYPELLTFTIALLFYTIFVWFFYRLLSKRDLFKLDLSRYELSDHRKAKKAWGIFLYVLKHGIIFPFYVAFWFIVFSFLLFIMSKNISARDIILISISLVSTVRITAYLKKEMSQDLAKLVPFAMLGIFLSDPNFFSMDLLIARIEAVPSLGWEMLEFMSFCIILEWFLRTIYYLLVQRKKTEGEVPVFE